MRVRIFQILAIGGFAVSTITGINNLVVGLPVGNAILCFATALLSLFLIIYATRTGRYRFCVMVTIVAIFLIGFSFLFFEGGGYKSGMPLYFVLAIVFTAFMLDGPLMAVSVAVEICWYICLCLYAYRHPESIMVFEDERGLLTDILIALPVVSLVIAVTLYVQLKFIRNKQKELEQAQKEALSANEAKSAFLASMSHDIRTPLNTITSMNELIAERTASQEIRGWTDSIRVSCDILLSLIGDILDLSLIESGQDQQPEAPYLTARLLKEAETTWKDAAERAALSFHLETEETLPSVLCGSVDSVRKIISNLMSNAIKYTDHGGISLRFFEKLPRPSEKGIIFGIQVKDTGIGIAQKDLERIFLPFERGDHNTRRGSEGTGLGLAIVKDLADSMGGTISCESRQGEGSTFTVFIPQKIEDPEPVGPRDSWSSISSRSETFASILAPDAKVLVVDDNEFNRQVMCTLLKPTLIHTDDVESGQEALEMLEIRDYDLIFMDIMMPEMDGIETLQAIRTAGLAENTPIIALTADALAGTRERLLELGFSEYMTKPVSMKQLGDLLIRYLGDHVRLIRDPNFRKISGEQKLRLQEMLLPFHICLEDAMDLDGSAVDSLRMRAKYFLDYKKEMDMLSEKERNSENLFHFVHSLKSAAKSIGANDLSELAAFIERRKGEDTFQSLMFPALQEEFRIVCEGIKLLLEEIGEGNEEDPDRG